MAANGICDQILSIAPGKDVGIAATSAIEGIGTSPALEDIRARAITPIQIVVTAPSPQYIITDAAIQIIVTTTTFDHVITAAAMELVCAVTANNQIVATETDYTA